MRSLSNKAGMLIILNLFKYVVGFFVPIAIARIITKTEYGTYQQLLLIGATCIAVARLGLPETILYFYGSAKEKQRNALVIQTAGLMLLSGLFFSIVVYSLEDYLSGWLNNAELKQYIGTYCFYLLAYVAADYSGDLLVAKDKYRQAIIYQMVESLLRAVMLIVPLILRPELSVLIGNLVLYGAIRFCFFSSLNWREWRQFLKEKQKTLFGFGQISYGAPLAASSMVGLIGRVLDRVLVGVNFSVEQFAVYAVGSLEIPLDVIFQSSVSKVLSASLPSLAKERRYAEIAAILKESPRKLSLVVVPVFVYLFSEAENFIVFLYSDKYRESAVVFRIYLFLVPLHMLIMSMVPRVTGRTTINFKLTVFSVTLNAVLSIFAVHYMGFYGPALATIVATWLTSIAYFYVVTRILEVGVGDLLPVSHIAKVFGICLFCAICGKLGGHYFTSAFFRLLASGTIYSILMVMLFYLAGILSEQERAQIRRMVSRFV